MGGGRTIASDIEGLLHINGLINRLKEGGVSICNYRKMKIFSKKTFFGINR